MSEVAGRDVADRKARKSMEPKHLLSMSMSSSTASNPDPPTIPIIIEPAKVKQARSVSLKYARECQACLFEIARAKVCSQDQFAAEEGVWE